jgi:hypothetical protein
MRSSTRVAAGIVAAVILATLPATAQVPGLPVYNQGVPRGIGIYGDLGFPNDAAGGGTAYGVTGRGGFGLFGATATLSSLNPDGPGGSDVSIGATLNYRLLGGPLVPLSATLQGGVSYSKPGQGFLPDEEVTAYHFPIGVGFALIIPNPALAIRPWLAPRLDIGYRTSGVGSSTDTNFGLSGGIELNLLNGFGIHAAYDRVFAKDVADQSTFGVGAHYTFRVPGL